MQSTVPKLITIGVIAEELGVTPQCVAQILRARPHIRPAAYAGNTRLFTSVTIAQVRYALNSIEARRGKGVDRG